MELREKGIDSDLVEELLQASAVDWLTCIARVREKKYGPARPANFRAQARQARFLEYRGFSSEQIRSVFK
jgi:regulatory protein